MKTIRDTLQEFLEEAGPGKPGSTASPSAVIRLFESYLDGWAHEDLNPFERQRFEQEYSENRRFCDIFDASHIKPHHLNAMLGHYAIRHGCDPCITLHTALCLTRWGKVQCTEGCTSIPCQMGTARKGPGLIGSEWE